MVATGKLFDCGSSPKRERVSPMRAWWNHKCEALTIKIAWILPRRLVYWCAIRLMANATQGKHDRQVVPNLLAMNALKRWE